MSVAVYTTAPDGSDPVWLDQLGQVTGWKHTFTFPGGPTAASFQFTAPFRFQHRALNPGRMLVAQRDSVRMWYGRLEQPRRDIPWDCSATGVAALAKDYAARASNIYTLNSVVDNAITDGLPWARTASLTNPAGSALSISDTLDGVLGVLVQQGGYWKVTTHGTVTTPALPTTPTLLTFGADVPGGRTFDNYVNKLSVAYNNAGSSGARTTMTLDVAADQARWGVVNRLLDLTGIGSIATADATAAGNAVLARSAGGPAWNEPLTLAAGQLFTTGGAKPDIALIRPGIVVRVMGLDPDTFGTGQTTADIPVGQVDYDDTTGTVQLTPLTSSRDDLTSLLAKFGVKA